MRGKQLFLIIFALVFITACGSSNTYFSSKNYKKNQLYYQYLTIIPDITEFVSKDEKDKIYTNKIINNKPLSEFEKQIIKNNLKVTIENNTYINCIDIYTDGVHKKLKIEERKVPNFSKPFYLPNNLNIFSSDFVFIIQDASFKLDYSNVGSTLGSSGTNVFYLSGEVEYVLFNKRQQEIISYGTIRDKISSLKAPTNDEYVKLLNQIISQVVTNTPFRKKDLASLKINRMYL